MQEPEAQASAVGPAQEIEAFLQRTASRRFHCEALNAWLFHHACVQRQQRQLQQHSNRVKRDGTNPMRKLSPFDEYCRSGKCQQGKHVYKLLRLGRGRE